MIAQNSSPEETWNALLSREEEKIKLAYLSLNELDRRMIFEHLEKMSTEKGWHQEQVISAQIALQTIRKINKN